MTAVLIKIAGNILSELYENGGEEIEKKRSIIRADAVKYADTEGVQRP